MLRALPLAAAAACLAASIPSAAAGPRPAGAPKTLFAPTTFLAPPSAPAAAPAPAPAGEVEPVTIATRDNLSLAADFYPPRKKGRAPAALLVHDRGGDRAQLSPIAERLQRLGFAVLALDMRGHGQSIDARYDWSKLDQESRERMWALTPRDLSAASEYLRGRDDVHTSNLSVIGLRAGSAVAVHYAADDQNARAVVMLDPQADGHGFNLVQDVGKLQGLPTLILAPSASRSIAERLARCGHDANGGHEYIQQNFLKGDGADLLSDKRMPREVADWLKDQVMPDKSDR